MTYHQVQLDTGITLAYEERGFGIPVVLLHGFCGSGAYWKALLPELAQSYRVIVPDLRGHGASTDEAPGPEGYYTVELMAEDIRSLLASLGIGKAVIVGHSLGGYIALALAEQAPEQLAALALVHSTAQPDSEEGRAKRSVNMERIRTEGIVSFAEDLVPRLFAEAHRETMKEEVEAATKLGRTTSAAGAIGALEAMRLRPDRTAVLSVLTVPVLLAAGAHDGILTPEQVHTAGSPLARRETIQDAGHMSMYEAPGVLGSLLLDWLDDATAGAAPDTQG